MRGGGGWIIKVFNILWIVKYIGLSEARSAAKPRTRSEATTTAKPNTERSDKHGEAEHRAKRQHKAKPKKESEAKKKSEATRTAKPHTRSEAITTGAKRQATAQP